MRYATAAVALATFAVLLGSAGAQEPKATSARSSVHVTVTTADVRETAHTRSDVLLLWNRTERSAPIGHAIKACIKAGSGGLLGGGLMSCELTVSLPLGKVSASGIVHNLNRYTLVITGGTGRYEGVTGPLFIRRVGDGVRRLTFTL